MNVMKYRSHSFLRLDDLRAGPYAALISAVQEVTPRNKWTPTAPAAPKLALIFPDGRALVLENRNLDILIDAYGSESDNWIGQAVQVFIETLPTAHGRGREVKRVIPAAPVAVSPFEDFPFPDTADVEDAQS